MRVVPLRDDTLHAVPVKADDLPVVRELGVGETEGGGRGEKQGEHQKQTRRMHRHPGSDSGGDGSTLVVLLFTAAASDHS